MEVELATQNEAFLTGMKYQPSGTAANYAAIIEETAIKEKKKKKLLYWRNPTDPKIRPDPTFFLNPKKKTTDRS